MSNVQQVKYIENFSYLNTDFGCQLALKKFDMTLNDLEKLVGRYTKGKRKGELRHKLSWWKITEGGWSYPLRCVIKDVNMTFGYHIVNYEGEIIYSNWGADSLEYSEMVNFALLDAYQEKYSDKVESIIVKEKPVIKGQCVLAAESIMELEKLYNASKSETEKVMITNQILFCLSCYDNKKKIQIQIILENLDSKFSIERFLKDNS